MKEHGLRRNIMRGWMAPAEDKRQTEDPMQRIANPFFFSVTIFALAFTYFVLSARAQDHHPRAVRNSMSFFTASFPKISSGLNSRRKVQSSLSPLARE